MQTTTNMQTQSIQPTSWLTLAFVAGVVIVLSGALWAGAAWQRINHMSTASGMVVQLDEYTDDHNILMYLPVVEFKAADGKTIRTRTSIYQTLNILGFDVELDSVMGAPDQYHVGDVMPVYYDPANPEDVQLNDWWQLWSTPLGISAIGLIVVAGALVFRVTARRMEPGA